MKDPLGETSAPAAFPVAVMMRRRPGDSSKPWLGASWQLTGVVVNSQLATSDRGGRKVYSGADGDDYLWGGFSIRLHKDEAESYYFNLMAEHPKVYVICSADDRGRPEPFLVSASFDEANAYMEVEHDAAAVPMPPELYQWMERYVLTHYVPERRVKRKRRRWTEANHDGGA